MRLLHYRTYGSESKPPLVLVHGIGGSASIFFKQIQFYKKHFFVVAIDLPGHGSSFKLGQDEDLNFELVSKHICHLLDHLQIEKAHFVGVSLGSIVIHHFMQYAPERVKKAVFAGAITSLDLRARFLLRIGSGLKCIMPYMWLYRFVAKLIMPKKNHLSSRELFVREAKKMGYDQFVKWYGMSQHTNGLYARIKNERIEKLYITGEEDHLLYRIIKKDVSDDHYAQFYPIPKCGHVCNIERPELFNEISIQFLMDDEVN